MLCWIDHVWSSKECVCCACDPNERLSAPPICFVCVLYVGSYLLIYEFESWITGVFSHYVISLSEFAYYVFGKSLQLLCILPFGMFFLSAISMMFVKIVLAVCMLVGMVV